MNGDLDLSSEELELLEVLIPPDWEPSQGDLMDAPGPLSDGNLLDSPGVPQPAPGDLMSRAPLSAEEFQPSVKGGIDLLSRYEREAPSIQNPAIQRFQDIALRWLPTDDKALQGARSRAQASADQLARLRLAAETQAQQYPWETFVAEMLAPRETPGFTSALSATMKAVGEEKRKRAGLARELGLKEAEAGATRATQEERAEMDRIRAGADLVRSAANMQRYANAYQKKQGDTAWERKMAALGINTNTPEGQLAARRMEVMDLAKSDPATLRTLVTNPDLDPFSQEFSEKVAKENLAMMEQKEKLVAAKEARAESKEERERRETNARIDKYRQDIEASRTKATEKPLPIPAQKQLTEASEMADATQNFSSTFQDDYAGYKIPAVGDVHNWLKLTFGDDSGQAQWWQAYDLHQNIIRNKLFGAALTKTEQTAWNKAAINIRMDPEQVKLNLARRAELELKGLNRLMSGYAAGKYSQEQIEAFTGRTIPPPEALKSPGVGSSVVLGPNEVRRLDPKTGKTAIFDSQTKKFVRWE